MNVNPHLQYLQQQQQQQQTLNAPAGQSPQVSQLQMQQRHLQQQRQQILSQHLQQQQQQPPQSQGLQPQTTNPLLAALNGGINGNSNLTPGSSFNNVNPLLQLQLQQLQQQAPQRVFSNNMQQQQQQQVLQSRAPIIKEVWNGNLEYEFNSMRSFINDKTSTVFILIHQEIPGIVMRPVGTFKSSADYHFQTLRSNLDLLNLIQLSLCAVKVRNNDISGSVIWQFNFLYDLSKEMFNEEHLSMLTSQINFSLHENQGIPHFAFAELMIESGLLLDPSINWLSYHSGYDLGFLVSLLTNDMLPSNERDFFWWCEKYFPNFYDLKHIGNQLLNKSTSMNANSSEFGVNSSNGNDKNLTSNNKPSVEYLAEELHLLPILPAIRQYFTLSVVGQFSNQPQQMSLTLYAYLLMECFKELFRQTNFDLAVFEKFKGFLWGLGDAYDQIDDKNGDKPETTASQQW